MTAAAATAVPKPAIILKPLGEQVIVITDADCDRGLAIARAASARGARMVLAAQEREALNKLIVEFDTAAACGQILAVEADATRAHDLQKIADAAVDHFGGFDSWIDTVETSLPDKLQTIGEDALRQLYEINFWSAVNGARIALPILKQNGGALIFLGANAATEVKNHGAAWRASKAAVKGFLTALREEIEAENAPVSLAMIEEQATPEDIAKTVLRAAEHVTKEAAAQNPAKTPEWISTLAAQILPDLLDWFTARYLRGASGADQKTTFASVESPTQEQQAPAAAREPFAQTSTQPPTTPPMHKWAGLHPLATLAIGTLGVAGALSMAEIVRKREK